MLQPIYMVRIGHKGKVFVLIYRINCCLSNMEQNSPEMLWQPMHSDRKEVSNNRQPMLCPVLPNSEIIFTKTMLIILGTIFQEWLLWVKMLILEINQTSMQTLIDTHITSNFRGQHLVTTDKFLMVALLILESVVPVLAAVAFFLMH